MNDKEKLLAMELAELWACSRIHLPAAAKAFVTQGNKANGVAADIILAFTGSSHRMETACSNLLDRYQDVMSISAENVYEACDTLDKVREAYVNNDGMNAERLKTLTRESFGAYTQQKEPSGVDLDGDGRSGEPAGTMPGREIVEPGNRPHVLDSANPLKTNPRYR